MNSPQTPQQIAQTVQVFGMKNPRMARIIKDVKTKMGMAFRKGDALVTVYESGIIETGPYAGKMGYSAFSIRNNVMTAIRPNSFAFTAAEDNARFEVAHGKSEGGK